MTDNDKTIAAGRSNAVGPGKTNDASSYGKAVRPTVPDYSPDAVLARLKTNAREAESAPLRIPGWLLLVVLAVIAIAGWFWYNGLGKAGAPLCVVNTRSDAPLEVRLDGKSIGHASKMIGEDPKAAVMARLGDGSHEVEARNNSGTVIASEKFVVNKGSYGFLWTPLPDPNSRFFLQTTSYGERVSEYITELDRESSLKPFPEFVSQWFRDNPKAVSVPKGWKSTHETALRRAKSP